MSINMSLTQFLTFSTKVSTSAKINYIKEVKNDSDYHPAKDYWKPLRDEIKRIHENGLPIETLDNLIERTTDEKKLKNYIAAVKTYKRFINSNEVEYFQTGQAFWKLRDDLYVNASPEFGLIINGEPMLMKNNYKKRSTTNKIDKRNINATLTLMQLAEKNFSVPKNQKYCVFNFQNGKVIESSPLRSESILELEMDAEFILNIWDQV